SALYLGQTDGMSVDEMKEMADELVANSKVPAVVLLAAGGEKANFVLKVAADLVKKGVHAGKLIKEVAKVAQGGGGGRPDMASAGGKDPSKIGEALQVGEKLISEQL
ncbi:MAG: alanine--tRNA ligase, partial [Candidatus Riflebacteria bacterium]|nr:alanine--tRNA ligase [Candidatus Riflebacteria bacterium]